mgnify:CR=1 FL=1
MKKTIAMMLALAAISTTAFASPQTTFRPGEFEINAGMWDSAARPAGYKSDGEWNFLRRGCLTMAKPPITFSSWAS